MMQRMFKTNLYGFAVQPVRRGPAVFYAKLPIRAFARMTLDTSDSMIKHDMVHFKLSTNDHPLGITKPPKVIPKFWEDPMSHPVWSENEVNQVKTTHFLPSTTSDGLALIGVNMTQWVFNTFTFYRWRPYTEEKVLSRIILMETIAAIPGMTASMIRHLRSLRRMDEDHGWIHTLLEEAENERLHLLTFLKLRKPGRILKLSVVTAQVGFMSMYVLAYLMNQKMCHRFVGYLDEEAVKTYTEILQAIDSGPLANWKTMPAPDIAKDYWHLRQGSTMRDVILAVRADKDHHRQVNHTLAGLRPGAIRVVTDRSTLFDSDPQQPVPPKAEKS